MNQWRTVKHGRNRGRVFNAEKGRVIQSRNGMSETVLEHEHNTIADKIATVEEPKFVMSSDVRQMIDMHNNQQFIIWIPPEEFLRIANVQTEHDRTESNVKHGFTEFQLSNPSVLKSLKESYESGKHVTVPQLFVEGLSITPVNGVNKFEISKNTSIYGHEGRNRSLVAMESGVREIPVIVDLEHMKNWYQGYTTYEHVNQEPERQREILNAVGVTHYRLDSARP